MPLIIISVSTRAAVEEMARMAIARHIGTTPGPKFTVGPYLESFWNWDGEYALRQARSGQPLTIAYLRNSKSIIKARAITWLRNRGHYDDLVQSVTTGPIEDMLMDLFESGVSAKQCNTVRRALSKPFAELDRRGTIYMNPVTHTLKFWEKKSKRQILNLVEAKKFFSIDTMDNRARVACLLAAASGLRISEILGLHIVFLKTSVDGLR
ncbi:MAG: hypothetical protein MI724_13900 [Spirochaetales bacterium]|nr:hypothetical protein [Spirochaetales bacterium]